MEKTEIYFTKRTDRGVFTIGTVAGYFHENKGEKIDQFCNVLMETAEEVKNETGIYISAVVQPSRTVYRKEWGCPESGEETYTVSATRNPEFYGENYEMQWKYSFALLAEKLKEKFKQSTVLIEFGEMHVLYRK